MEEIYVVTTKGIIKKSENSGDYIREISTKEDLEELIERMPYIPTIQAPNSRARKELYQLSMNEYDDVEWVKIIKSVHLRMEDSRYEEFEPEYAEKAKEFLHKEFSVRYHIPPEDVDAYIHETLEKQLKEF